jgi:hypothetical protein
MKTLKLSFAGLAALVGFSGAFAFTTRADNANFASTTYYAQATATGFHWTLIAPSTFCGVTATNVYCTLVSSVGRPSDDNCPILPAAGYSTPDPGKTVYSQN